MSEEEEVQAGAEFSSASCDNYRENPLNKIMQYFTSNELRCYFNNTSNLFYTIKDVKLLGTNTKDQISMVQNSIKENIMTYGSVMGGFCVLSDFLTGGDNIYNYDSLKSNFINNYNPLNSWKNGVYIESTNAKYAGGHAVSLIGWGYDDDLAKEYSCDGLYWIIRNSWGTNWAEKGFGKIAAYPINKLSQFSYYLQGESVMIGGESISVFSGTSVSFKPGQKGTAEQLNISSDPLSKTSELELIMNHVKNNCDY